MSLRADFSVSGYELGRVTAREILEVGRASFSRIAEELLDVIEVARVLTLQFGFFLFGI